MHEIKNLELRLQVSEELIIRIFSEIEEYAEKKICNMDLLIKGMAYIATQPIQPSESTSLLDVFAESLIKAAVEAGSKGVV